jgi:hypothetical protein
MEYCGHCRAIRPTRKSTRKRTVRQSDGTVKTIIVDSFHCSRCNHFVGSVEREAAPGGGPSTPAGEPAAASQPAAQPLVPAEMPEEVEAAQAE